MTRKSSKNAELPHFYVKESRATLVEQINLLDSEPLFVRMYLQTLSSLTEKNEKKTKLLYYLLENMNSKDNKVAIDPMARDELLEAIDVGRSLYYKYMQELEAYGYITRVARCIYMINPHLFFKGYWGAGAKKTRIEYIDLRLKFDGKAQYTITAKARKSKSSKSTNKE
jgi:hypothetical protein